MANGRVINAKGSKQETEDLAKDNVRLGSMAKDWRARFCPCIFERRPVKFGEDAAADDLHAQS